LFIKAIQLTRVTTIATLGQKIKMKFPWMVILLGVVPSRVELKVVMKHLMIKVDAIGTGMTMNPSS
jgi:hypothetical protein